LSSALYEVWLDDTSAYDDDKGDDDKDIGGDEVDVPFASLVASGGNAAQRDIVTAPVSDRDASDADETRAIPSVASRMDAAARRWRVDMHATAPAATISSQIQVLVRIRTIRDGTAEEGDDDSEVEEDGREDDGDNGGSRS
jgi:hypothetical protein